MSLNAKILTVIGLVVLTIACFFVYTYAIPMIFPPQDKNTNQATVEPETSSNGYVEYKDSYGETCPLNVRFQQGKNSPEINCECPEGHVKQSQIIGYDGGDKCYGAGSECPIMGVWCD